MPFELREKGNLDALTSNQNSVRDGSGDFIRSLPPEVIAQIRSSAVIQDLNGVAAELVKNSLDASSTNIDLTVDFQRGNCVVEDNGNGIPPAEFEEQGGLGKLYCTSKYKANGDVYGQHGAFLSLLSGVSLLKVISRHYRYQSRNSLTIHHSEVIKRQTPYRAGTEYFRAGSGTTVSVHNLFGNMPVRIKRRAIALEEKEEVDRLWGALKRQIAEILIAWRKPVICRLRQQNEMMTTTLGQRPVPAADTLNTLAMRKNHLDLFFTIMSQTSSVHLGAQQSWISVSASTSDLVIKGAISLDAVPTKKVQLITLGILPLERGAGNNVLYDEVNRLFEYSDFGIIDDQTDSDEPQKERRVRGDAKKGILKRELRQRKKGVDRWPMFFLKMDAKDTSKRFTPEDLALQGCGKFQSVLETLNTMMFQWLSVHHFNPRATKRQSRKEILDEHGEVASPGLDVNQPNEIGQPSRRDEQGAEPIRRTRRSRKGSPKRQRPAIDGGKAKDVSRDRFFKDWSRIKSSSSDGYKDFWTSSNQNPTDIRFSTTPSFSLSNEAGRSTTGSAHPTVPNESLRRSATPTDGLRSLAISSTSRAEATTSTHNFTLDSNTNVDNISEWIDPITQRKHYVNSRTGCAVRRLHSQDPIPKGRDDRDHERPSGLGPKKAKRLKRSIATPNQSCDTLPECLKDWENPIFKLSEQPIAQATLVAAGEELTPLNVRAFGDWSQKDYVGAFKEATSLTASHITRDELRNATVISQVDRKFILVKVTSTPSTAPSGTLAAPKTKVILIDQHAADERVRIEHLLSEFCSPPLPTDPPIRSRAGHPPSVRSTTLDKPAKFLIPAHEAAIFRARAAHFARWGIIYDITTTTNTTTPSSNSPTAGPAEHAVSVHALPPLIAERCRADPALLADLLRAEAHRTSDDHHHNPPTTTTSDLATGPAPAWVRLAPRIPPRIKELLDSRACRGAVMFNDALAPGECEAAVREVAECAFPFQCAHGRPSMVPLLEMAGGGEGEEVVEEVEVGLGLGVGVGGNGSGDGRGEGGFERAYRRWKRAQRGEAGAEDSGGTEAG